MFVAAVKQIKAFEQYFIMKKREKSMVVALLGAIGLIVLLGGIFLNIYAFIHGLFAAIVIWILTGVLKKYWGIKKE
jgi:hypothetical protein